MSKIRLKGLVMEDFCNYQKPSMFLITCFCDWKCCTDKGYDLSICQNNTLTNTKIESYELNSICDAYIMNDLIDAIVIGGLEPLLQVEEILELIRTIREDYHCEDDIVIYTGYTEDEVSHNSEWSKLKQPNVIIKYGRFVLNDTPRYDDVLGVMLASQNQYAVRY